MCGWRQCLHVEGQVDLHARDIFRVQTECMSEHAIICARSSLCLRQALGPLWLTSSRCIVVLAMP